jgi:molybdopterin-biosynthesis enzyme MoeA-like protein
MLPELSKLRMAPADTKGWPILQCENVFILPGVPQYFEQKMAVIADHFLTGHAMAVAKVSNICSLQV